MLTRVLRTIRLRQGRNPVIRALRAAGVTAALRKMYERRVLARGHQDVVLHGHRLRFVVTSRREIDRLDSMTSEAGFIGRMIDALEPGDAVFDVGANIGTVSLVLAATRPDVRVHAFEPEPRNAAHLRENVRINGMGDRVAVHEVALGAAEGAGRLRVTGEVGEGTHALVGEVPAGEHALRVAMEPADGFAARHGAPDLVKIDVEGGEIAVIEGMAGLLREQAVRELFLEVHVPQLAEAGWDADRLGAWLGELGYRRVWEAARGPQFHQHYRPTEPGAGPGRDDR